MSQLNEKQKKTLRIPSSFERAKCLEKVREGYMPIECTDSGRVNNTER